jgi:hypothetical protein
MRAKWQEFDQRIATFEAEFVASAKEDEDARDRPQWNPYRVKIFAEWYQPRDMLRERLRTLSESLVETSV